MLCLTRKVGTAITLRFGDQIARVEFSSVNGQYVHVAIDAPKEVRILRSELEPEEERS